MCGINGFTFADERLIRAMNEKTNHRGPDATDLFVDENISLGHNRLAIIDLTATGAQPMANEDGSIVLVFNGEIYNFQELREELKNLGYSFRGGSDTEVIIHSYEAWGIDCVKRFNGIFAFALWNKKTQELFLVRDQIGIKPLYYTNVDGNLIFSSEIKSILEHQIKREVDLQALNIYLRMLYVPAPLTMFKNIFKLEPGHFICYSKGSVKLIKYWEPDTKQKISSKGEAIEKIKFFLEDSVRRQMISERPVGVFLSGGIDSTAVLGLAAKISGKTIDTFSVGFSRGGDKFNADLRLAKQTSEYYKTNHHELIISGEDVLKYFSDVVYHMDEPVSNATQVATYLLSKFARKDVVVALGGDGGDELFGGYERYRLSAMVSFYQSKIPLLTQSFLTSIMTKLPVSFREEVEKITVPPGAPRLISFMAQKENDISKFFNSKYNQSDLAPKFFEKYFLPSPDAENALMWADARTWLPDESLIRSDKLSMAFALEQRVPILDYRLVELSLNIPSAWKFNSKETKTLFKSAVSSYIPKHLVGEPKRGWTSPASEWLRHDLRPLVDEVFVDGYAPGTSEFFNFEELKKMYIDHVDRKAYNMNLLWAVLTFQIWHKIFINK